MSAYYNEIEPYAAQWLRNLIADGHIAAGEVDERSIVDVRSDDLRGFTQCHFFAGLGGWSFALRLAGWSDDRPIWTGSCPCQPFSVAGNQAGFDDHRHLWPQFRRLIGERHPATVFGEQVAGASDWLGLVRGDLEAMDYAVGAIPMEAASADAEHFRDRYWFVADSNSYRGTPGESTFKASGYRCSVNTGDSEYSFRSLAYGNVGHYFDAQESLRAGWNAADDNGLCLLENSAGIGGFEGKQVEEYEAGKASDSADRTGLDLRQYLECPDGKWRRLPPPRVRWLGNGISARVAKLRAFGNAIDPRPAAQFIAAFMECRP